MAPKIELFYFDAQGRAEAIRLALSVAALEFTDTRYKHEDWPKHKDQFPTGSVPAIQIDGKMYSQTQAILKWAGSQNNANLYPKEPMAALVVDQALGIIDDITSKFKMNLPEEELKASRKEFTEAIVKAFGYLEKKMEEHKGKYLCGDGMTIADLVSLVMIDWIESGILDHVDKTLMAKYSKVMAAKKLTGSHAAIVAWQKKSAAKA
eukprot:Filipodium_phascolosomae@DN938_c0_g1_i1.p1